mmetsp:Transcript_17303/g.55861  ORF Transcript_17303/g.55861 Transcript_17303/m.55861 type:complete len:177 (+) Transcript_17303:1013-1543(+)
MSPSLIYLDLLSCPSPLPSIYHPGVMRPLLIQVAEPKRRGSIIAWQHALEGSCAAIFGSPMVGFLSERAFGYRPSSAEVDSMDPTLRANNLAALQRAISVMTLVPLSVCFVVNSYLHIAYPRDKRMWAEEGISTSRKDYIVDLDAFDDKLSEAEETSTLVGRRFDQRTAGQETTTS